MRFVEGQASITFHPNWSQRRFNPLDLPLKRWMKKTHLIWPIVMADNGFAVYPIWCVVILNIIYMIIVSRNDVMKYENLKPQSNVVGESIKEHLKPWQMEHTLLKWKVRKFLEGLKGLYSKHKKWYGRDIVSTGCYSRLGSVHDYCTELHS